jgi:hypothetical protein
MTASACVSVTVNVTTPLALDAPLAAEMVELPLPAVSVTVFPDTGLLFASFKVTVIVEVVEPSATTEVGDATTVDTVDDTGPAVTVTVGDAAIFVSVPPLPSLVCVVKVSVPAVVVAVTWWPLVPYVTLNVSLAAGQVMGIVITCDAKVGVPGVQEPAVTLVLVDVGAVHPVGTVIVASEPDKNTPPVKLNVRVLVLLPEIAEVGDTVIVPDPLAATATKLAMNVAVLPLPLGVTKVQGLVVEPVLQLFELGEVPPVLVKVQLENTYPVPGVAVKVTVVPEFPMLLGLVVPLLVTVPQPPGLPVTELLAATGFTPIVTWPALYASVNVSTGALSPVAPAAVTENVTFRSLCCTR